MIENPQIGQRVWWLDLYDGHSTAESGTVTAMDVEPFVWVRDKHGDETERHRAYLYDSPTSAASALRAEAQRLIDAADKLESEASGDPLQ